MARVLYSVPRAYDIHECLRNLSDDYVSSTWHGRPQCPKGSSNEYRGRWTPHALTYPYDMTSSSHFAFLIRLVTYAEITKQMTPPIRSEKYPEKL